MHEAIVSCECSVRTSPLTLCREPERRECVRFWNREDTNCGPAEARGNNECFECFDGSSDVVNPVFSRVKPLDTARSVDYSTAIKGVLTLTIGDGSRSGPRNASQDEIRLPTYRLFIVLCVLRSATSLWACAVADFDYSYNNTREVLVCRSMCN